VLASHVREKVVPLVVDHDERWKIDVVDFPDGFHPEVLYAWFIPWMIHAGVRRRWRSFLIAALLVFSLSPHRNPGTSDTIAMFVLATVLIAAGFAAWRWWKLRQLESMLAQLAPTDLQITRSEMRGRMLSGMSVKQLWLVVTLSVLAGAANLASGAYALSLGQSGVASIISGVIFVAVGFYYALHLVSRMKAAA